MDASAYSRSFGPQFVGAAAAHLKDAVNSRLLGVGNKAESTRPLCGWVEHHNLCGAGFIRGVC